MDAEKAKAAEALAKADADERARAEAEAAAQEKKEAPLRKLMKAFDKFDTDGNGTITQAELTAVMMSLNPEKFTEESCKDMFDLADSNDDGLVDYEEFCEWLFEESPVSIKTLSEAAS
jgi:hypothetical protein